MSSGANYTELTTEIAFAGLPLGEILRQFETDNRVDSQLPVDLEFVLDYAVGEGVSDIALNAAVETGEIEIADSAWSLNNLVLNGKYSAQTDEFAVSVDGQQWGPFTGDLVLILEDAVKGSGERGFRVNGNVLQMDLTPRFELPLEIQALQAEGIVDFQSRRVHETTVSFESGDVRMLAELDLQITPDRLAEEVPINWGYPAGYGRRFGQEYRSGILAGDAWPWRTELPCRED